MCIRDRWRSFCRFLGHSTQTDCGSCSADPKRYHPAKRSLQKAMCKHTGGVLRNLVVVFHCDICREHSLIGRRNCLMTEAGNSAVASPELSIARNPIANLASDQATPRLAWVRVCVLWRPSASVGKTQENDDCIAPRLVCGDDLPKPRFQ